MDPNARSYNLICGQWHTYRTTKPVNRCIAEFAAMIEPGSAVLDVGCGTGYPTASYLSERGYRVTGIDISDEMIRLARDATIPNTEFLVCDLLEYRPSKTFDAVIAFDSLWHIPLERQERIYGIIGDLVRRGGYFLFTHGKRHGSVSGQMFGQTFTYSALDAIAVHDLLNQNGFEVLSSIEDYAEETTGDRELLIIARKAR